MGHGIIVLIFFYIFIKIYLFYVFICLCLHEFVCTAHCTYTGICRGQKRALNVLGLELQGVVSCPARILGIKLSPLEKQ